MIMPFNYKSLKTDFKYGTRKLAIDNKHFMIDSKEKKPYIMNT